MPQVISANRLKDGTVVYLDPNGGWAEHLGAAAVFASDSDAQAGLAKAGAAVADNVVVDPLVVPIVEDAGGLHATTLRNAIRDLGPTVKYKTSPAAAARR